MSVEVPRNAAEKLVYILVGVSHHEKPQLDLCEQTKLHHCCKEAENILVFVLVACIVKLDEQLAREVGALLESSDYGIQQYCQHQIAVMGPLQ